MNLVSGAKGKSGSNVVRGLLDMRDVMREAEPMVKRRVYNETSD
jgi:hypothetical protein